MEYILNRPDIILKLLGQHLFMTVSALLISTAIALPLSLVLLRSERVTSAVLGVLGVLYTIPSIALLILLLPLFGLNQTSVIVPPWSSTPRLFWCATWWHGTAQEVPPATLEAANGRRHERLAALVPGAAAAGDAGHPGRGADLAVHRGHLALPPSARNLALGGLGTLAV
jgi:ABC-type proline/glycine betaine transport system permease subunit